MKKKYFTPCMELHYAVTELLIATSLGLNNNAQKDISGDAKGDDWGDIWEDSSFED